MFKDYEEIKQIIIAEVSDVKDKEIDSLKQTIITQQTEIATLKAAKHE